MNPVSPFIPRPAQRLQAKPAAGAVLVVALALGALLAMWRIGGASGSARLTAQNEAHSLAAALQLEFSQAASAAEILAATARQNGGGIPNFQQVGAEMLKTRPGLAYVALESAGVVSDIVPRAGNERAIGFNALKDPSHQASANLAARNRTVAVAGFVALPNGQAGLVARMPIYTRERDGREYFRGFTSAAVAFGSALSRAGIEELVLRGYGYRLSIPATGDQPQVLIAGQGNIPFQDAATHAVAAQNVEFGVAVKPLSGWVNKAKATLDCLGLALVGVLLTGLTYGWMSLAEATKAAAETGRKLTQAVEDKKLVGEEARQAKETLLGLRNELQVVHARAQEADARIVELETAIETANHNAQIAAEAAQAERQQAQARAAELDSQLQAAAKSAREAEQSAHAEAEQLRATAEQAQQKIAELEVRLKSAEVARKEQESAAQARLKEETRAVSRAQARLEEVTRAAKTEAEQAAKRIEQLEAAEQELKARLEAAAAAEARIAELNVLLEQTRQELEHGQAAAAAEPEPEPLPEEEIPEPPPAPAEPQEEAAAEPAIVEPEAMEEPVVEAAPVEPAPVEASVVEPVVAEPEPVVPAPVEAAPEEPVAEAVRPPAEELAEQSAPEPEPRIPAEALEPLPGEPEPVIPAPAAVVDPEPAPAVEPPRPAEKKPAKSGGRKKTKRDNQMDLFGGAAEPPAPPPPAEPEPTTGDLFSAPPAASEPPEPEEPAFEPEPVDEEPAEIVLEPIDPDPPEEEPVFETPKPREERAAPARSPRALPPVVPAQLRKAANEILPLLADQDPGAKDCLKANRATLRSALGAEGFDEFEQLLKKGDAHTCLDLLRKACKKHGISI